MFDESKCGCSWPNARPPCSYCESDDGPFFEKKQTKYHKPIPKETEADLWKRKYNKLVKELADFKASVKEDVRKGVYEEELEEMQAYARSEVYADLRDELRNKVYQAEIADIRKKLWDDAREELLAQARKEVLKQIEEAKDKI